MPGLETHQQLIHRVEFVDHHNPDPRACVPDRVYIDGIEITAALAFSPLGVPYRWSVENHRGALVVGLSLYPGKTKVWPDHYGPGTYRVELIHHPEMDPIELCTPDFGPDTPPVMSVPDPECDPERYPGHPGTLPVRYRQVVRFYAESVQFRHARLSERVETLVLR